MPDPDVTATVTMYLKVGAAITSISVIAFVVGGRLSGVIKQIDALRTRYGEAEADIVITPRNLNDNE